jgi:nicotinate phosphoribosyltransferase
MRIDEPILTSILDDDLYKLTTAAVVFHNFPHAIAQYEFINRSDRSFPIGFEEELRRQIELMKFLHLGETEYEWMIKNLNYLPPTFIEWFRGYRLNPNEVSFRLIDNRLKLKIEGPWYRTIFWEVKLMAVISELFFRLSKQEKTKDWESRILTKSVKMNEAGAQWIDFGTRRRFSFEVQDRVVDVMKEFSNFLGTSNPYLAYKYGTKVYGTYPHEAIMAMSDRVGVRHTNSYWLKLWQNYYGQNLPAVALTDTYTTKIFLQDCGPLSLALRQDSGDPNNWADNIIIPFYQKKAHPLPKFIFSDNLNVTSYLRLHKKYSKVTSVVGGIGTYLTNDVDALPINMVIKLTGIALQGGPCMPVVKLSDDPAKYTGNRTEIEKVLSEIRS